MVMWNLAFYLKPTPPLPIKGGNDTLVLITYLFYEQVISFCAQKWNNLLLFLGNAEKHSVNVKERKKDKKIRLVNIYVEQNFLVDTLIVTSYEILFIKMM